MTEEVGARGPDGLRGPDAIQIPLEATRLGRSGLLASGGWCAPSEAVYDGIGVPPEAQVPRKFRGPRVAGYWLDEASLPQVTVKRGGIKFDELPSAEVMAQRNMHKLITEAVNGALRKQLDAEEAIAAGAIAAGCGYAVVGEEAPSIQASSDDDTYSFSQTWRFVLLRDWPRVERLTFPSFDAYEDWAALPLEQRLREIDEFKPEGQS